MTDHDQINILLALVFLKLSMSMMYSIIYGTATKKLFFTAV